MRIAAIRVTPAAVAMLFLLAADAIASDSAEQARAIQKAWHDHAIEHIRSAATQSDSDAWLVVHELLVLGEPLAAKVFVGYLPEPEARGALGRYLSVRDASPATEDVDLLAAAREARLHGSALRSVEILRPILTRCNIMGVLVEEERGTACRDLGTAAESASHMVQAAEYAHAIGWHSRRNYLLRYVVADAGLGPSGWSVDSAFLTGAERSVASGECLVAYVSVQQGIVAVVVEGGKSSFIPLGRADRIVEQCTKLTTTRGAVGAAAAHELLLTPLRLGAAAERIIVVPTGRLSAVPFSAIEPNRQIVYAPVSYPVARCGDALGTGILSVKDAGHEKPMASGADVVISLEGPQDIQKLQARCSQKWRCIRFDSPYDWTTDTLGSQLKVEKLLALNPRADLLVFASSYSGRMRLERGYGLLEGIADARVRGLPLERLKEAMELIEQRRKGRGIAPVYLLDESRPQVLVHLWEMDEEAGRILLDRFYELWNPAKGIGAGEALFRAQAYVRSQARWTEPRYWAGWQLWGNAKNTEDVSVASDEK